MSTNQKQAKILASRLSNHPLVPALDSVAAGETTGVAANAVLVRASKALEYLRLSGYNL